MNTNTDSGYTLTWHTNHAWSCETPVVVEDVFPINDVQHMVTRRCVCGAITKFVSK